MEHETSTNSIHDGIKVFDIWENPFSYAIHIKQLKEK